MKCSNCGYESQEDFIYCTNCGTAVSGAPAVSLNPVADRVLAALKDKLFLVICILMSAATVLPIISGGGLPIINILITIFLWLTYAQSTKNYANPDHIRGISGTVYASYIINNVLAVILVVCGFIVALTFGIVADVAELIDIIKLELNNAGVDLATFGLGEEIFSIIGWALGFVFVLAGAVMLVFNILGMRKIHRFVKSVYVGILTQNGAFEKPRAARNWLIFFAVCSCISTVSALGGNIMTLIANGSLAAAEILAIIIINKYFLSTEN